jgi:carboxyl-terminal processing protease
VLVGETTLGYASILRAIESPYDGSAIELTTARYYTPNGQLIDEAGIAPDVEVELSLAHRRELACRMSERDALPDLPPPEAAAEEEGPAPPEEGAGEPQEEEGAEEEEVFRDAQLRRAVDVLADLLGGKAPPESAEPAAAGSAEAR